VAGCIGEKTVSLFRRLRTHHLVLEVLPVNKLRLGLPMGSLQEATLVMMKKAGYNITVERRSYFPKIDDEELEGVMIRAQEIPRYVNDGVLDAGLTGLDWITENRADVVEVSNLVYAKQGLNPVRLVIAVPNDSPINTVQDLQGKRIATELVNVTNDYLAQHGVTAEVEYSWGATEAKAPELVDAIVDLTETGSSLKANNLRIMEVVLESTTRLIANKESWEDAWKRKKLENIATLLQGALRAAEKVGLKMNVPRAALDSILTQLPALKNPTVANLTDEEWVAVETIIDEKVVREIIPALREAGATGIIEYPLNKVIP